MTIPLATDRSDATRRAALIYAEARSQIDVRLWRAALGNSPETATTSHRVTASPTIDMATQLALGRALATTSAGTTQPKAPAGANRGLQGALPFVASMTPADKGAAAANPPATSIAGLGANSAYSATIADAARRTGIPAAALASIIDAEAAKNKAGVWQTNSRNSRSSATGLGQFLSGTWTSEAQRAGTWLNNLARRNGWIGAHGTVKPEMKEQLLAMRRDGEASIHATADYARQSLDKLAAAGATIGNSVDEIAHAAYLGHNLGLGDAIRFLKGGIGEDRARRLLDAQIGSAAANRQTAAVGGAAAAHRGWLLDFIARHVKASRFAG